MIQLKGSRYAMDHDKDRDPKPQILKAPGIQRSALIVGRRASGGFSARLVVAEMPPDHEGSGERTRGRVLEHN